MTFENEIKNFLLKNFPNALIDLQDYAGDDNHFTLKIKDASLMGKKRLEQHRIINKILNPLYEKGLHALQIEILE